MTGLHPRRDRQPHDIGRSNGDQHQQQRQYHPPALVFLVTHGDRHVLA